MSKKNTKKSKPQTSSQPSPRVTRREKINKIVVTTLVVLVVGGLILSMAAGLATSQPVPVNDGSQIELQQ